MKWPDNKRFAFTIFDDTDAATLENVKPVYSLLNNLGFRTTKSVWPLRGSAPDQNAGDTCEDDAYLDWLQVIRQQGFEIGYHMAAWDTSNKNKTELALKKFVELFGEAPKVMANHSRCRENIYWGPDRLSGLRKAVYNAVTLGRYRNRYRGHTEDDPLFWGDLCQKNIKYVRSFTLPEINTFNFSPLVPYHDTNKPFVNFWFTSADGPDVDSYNHLLSEANQNRLEAESGLCIVYTHFGVGFCGDGRVDARFKMLMEKLAKKNGWFAPVSQVLDYLQAQQNETTISNRALAKLEWRWLRHKLLKGRS